MYQTNRVRAAFTQINEPTFFTLVRCQNPIPPPCYQIYALILPTLPVIPRFIPKRFIQRKNHVWVRLITTCAACWTTGRPFLLSSDKVVTEDPLTGCDLSWEHPTDAYPLPPVNFSSAVTTETCWDKGNKWQVLVSHAFPEAGCTRFLPVYPK